MKIPFLGMNPYLEEQWGDFRAGLVVYASGRLNRSLPRGLVSRISDRRFREPGDRPDDEMMCQSFITIHDIHDERSVRTVVEFLCPSNKRPGEGQEMYLRDRRERERRGVSLVEIDLLRDGRSVLALDDRDPTAHHAAYAACVHRGWRPGEAEFYPMPLREPLPMIRIPLGPGDPEVFLDLQALLAERYEKGCYGEDIDYTTDPVPPLSAEDAAWADALLRGAGRR